MSIIDGKNRRVSGLAAPETPIPNPEKRRLGTALCPAQRTALLHLHRRASGGEEEG